MSETPDEQPDAGEAPRGLDEAIAAAEADGSGPEWTDDDVAAAGAEPADDGGGDDIADLLASLDMEQPVGRAPWRDGDVADQLGAGGPPGWLGRRWREIPAPEQPEALAGLREWVDWLVAEFDIPRSVIPPCWFCHPAIVAELHAGMNLEYKVWEEGAPTSNPMLMWLPHLSAMVGRLRAVMGELSSCAQGKHEQPPVRRLSYDEGLWEQHVAVKTSHKRVDQPATGQPLRHVRAIVVDEHGKQRASSGVGGVRPVGEVPGAEISLSGSLVPGAGAVVLEATWQGAGEVAWQVGPGPEGPWSDLDGHDDDEEDSGENGDE